ncbi:uncharacterized protein O8D03_006039 [Erethizon dorsatum]
MRNHTSLDEFILLGVPQTEGWEPVLFVIFSFIYLFTLLGNSLIFTAVISSSTLHTPMYFFLGLLSIFDMLFPSVTCPKMLLYLSGRSRAISYEGCAAQLFFYHFLGSTEGCLYSVMAYDRFVAICHPLRYMLIMKPEVCVSLVTLSFLIGCLQATTLTSFTFQLTYCGPRELNHFFCDIPAVLPLACNDSSLAQRVGSINVGLLALMLLFSVCVSYTHIGIAILRMRSAEGRQKAFSTCSAHLTAILCAYGPVIIIYLQRTPNPLLGAVVQILNNIVSPMLNSLIYSLRNKEVKNSLKKVLQKTTISIALYPIPGHRGQCKTQPRKSDLHCELRHTAVAKPADDGARRLLLKFFLPLVDSSTKMRNHTMVTEFVLLGIPETEGVETALFFLFSSLYLCTLLGNVLILTAIFSSSRLHTPMYFFLGNLSIFDLGFSSTTVPKMLSYLSGHSQGISFQGCNAQLFFYHFLGCTECFLYTVMAYDRFVAICYPLRYMVIMNNKVCSVLATGTWMSGCVHAIILTSLIFKLPFCGSNQVGYYFCDIPAVLPLACEDTSLAQKVGFTNVGLLTLICLFLILVSYIRIGISILKIRSTEGRQRAFSTCSAHLTAILCAYGPVIIIYLQPNPSPLLGAVIQMLNNLVTPMLNPLIYSLRNKDVKLALKHIFLKRSRALEIE